jgi:hypothetical protein
MLFIPSFHPNFHKTNLIFFRLNLHGISPLKKLEYLDVSGNFIRHIEDLEDIQHL